MTNKHKTFIVKEFLKLFDRNFLQFHEEYGILVDVVICSNYRVIIK